MGDSPPQPAEFLRITVGYRDIFGVAPTLDDVLWRLHRYDLTAVLLAVSQVQLLLDGERLGLKEWPLQVAICGRLFGPHTPRMLDRLQATRGALIPAESSMMFHDLQQLNLARLALAHLPLRRTAGRREPLFYLGEAMLMLNDLFGESFPEWADASGRLTDAIELHTFANFLFHRGGSDVADMARAFDLFIRPRVPGNEGKVLRAKLTRAFGLPPEQAYFGMRALLAHFSARSLDEVERGKIAVDLSRYFNVGLTVRVADAQGMFRTLCLPIESMMTVVRRDHTPSKSMNFYDLDVFDRHPIVSHNNLAICLSMRAIRRQLGMGMMSRFVDPEVFTPREIEKFHRELRAHVVEHYVKDALVRAFGRDRVIDEHAVKGVLQVERQGPASENGPASRQGEKNCDFMVDYGDRVLLVEVKGTVVHHRARTGESFLNYKRSLAEKFDHALKQFCDAIQAIHSGRYRPLGLDPRRVRAILPIIVSVDANMTPFVYKRLREGVTDHAVLASSDVFMPGLIDLGEVDLLEQAAASGMDVFALLAAWRRANDANGIPFRNYCLRRKEPWTDKLERPLERWRAQQQEVLAFFEARSW